LRRSSRPTRAGQRKLAAGGRRGLPESVNRCCSQTAQHVTEGEARRESSGLGDDGSTGRQLICERSAPVRRYSASSPGATHQRRRASRHRTGARRGYVLSRDRVGAHDTNTLRRQGRDHTSEQSGQYWLMRRIRTGSGLRRRTNSIAVKRSGSASSKVPVGVFGSVHHAGKIGLGTLGCGVDRRGSFARQT